MFRGPPPPPPPSAAACTALDARICGASLKLVLSAATLVGGPLSLKGKPQGDLKLNLIAGESGRLAAPPGQDTLARAVARRQSECRGAAGRVAARQVKLSTRAGQSIPTSARASVTRSEREVAWSFGEVGPCLALDHLGAASRCVHVDVARNPKPLRSPTRLAHGVLALPAGLRLSGQPRDFVVPLSGLDQPERAPAGAALSLRGTLQFSGDHHLLRVVPGQFSPVASTTVQMPGGEVLLVRADLSQNASKLKEATHRTPTCSVHPRT